jgi:ABC-type transport system involved in multi-copper enzyme maturation permease subunit
VTTIIRLTILEATRKRLIWALLLLTMLVVGLTGWGVSLLVTNARANGVPESQIQFGVSQVVLLLAYNYRVVLALTAAFLGAPALASDLDSGIALAMLARPIRRSEVLLGRWIGLALVLGGYAILGGGLELAVVALVSDYVPPQPVIAIGFLVAEAIVTLTVAIVLGSRLSAMAGGAVAVVLFGLSWVAGVLGAVAAALNLADLTAVTGGARLLLPIDGLWRGVVFNLQPAATRLLIEGFTRAGENAAAFAAANPFFATNPPSLPYLGWVGAWIVAMLALAIVLFRRREP